MKKFKTKLLTILIILAVAVIAFFVVLFAFRVTNIHVTGNEMCSEEEVIKAYTSGPLGDNMLMIKIKDRLGRFDKLPFIRDYEISYNGLNEMTIQVYEKTLAACFYYMGSYIFFDKDGMILEIAGEKKKNIPCVEGVKFNTFTINEMIDLDNKEQIDMILNLAELINLYGVQADRIYFDNRSEVTLYCKKITVLLGRKKLYDQQIASVSDVLRQAKKDKLKGVIDLKNYKKGDRIIIRQQ